MSLATPLLCLVLAWSPRDDDDGRRAPSGVPLAGLQGASLTSPATERAVDRGLAYLASLQARSGDGSFAITDVVDPTGYAPLGISALCALAFLSAGNAPDRGPHGEVVTRVLEYLLLHTDLALDSSVRGLVSVQGDKVSRAHGHGYATLVLAEAYGMSSGSERIRTALVAAVERIEKSQGAEGGWFYAPNPVADHEGSVTICLVQALRAARDAGIQVDANVIHRAEDYVRRLQNESGLFRYKLNDPRASVGLTAASISTLNAAGHYDERVIQDGIDAIWSELLQGRDRRPDFPEYERFYVAQAFWQLSDTSHFLRWFAEERDRILGTQQDDGSWKGSQFGSAYVTAVNCLVLTLPDAALPIFQR